MSRLAPRTVSGLGAVVMALLSALGLAFAFKFAMLVVSGEFQSDSATAILAGFFNSTVLLYGGGVLAALAIEAALTGWERSSLRRLFVNPSDSARGDLFFVFMALSGGTAAAASLLSAGMVDVSVQLLDAQSATGPLRNAPVWLAAPLLYLGMTFFNYWNHRLLHTRLLWRLHAVHHSAHEFTVCNAARVSPMEVILITVSQAIPAALLGASAEALMVASLIASFEILWTHSNVRGFEWLERVGISSPRAHTIHHARDARYHDHNFGDLVLLWDQLFGTYMNSRSAPEGLAMGVDGIGENYDSREPLRDFFRIHRDWLLAPLRSSAIFRSGARSVPCRSVR